MSKEEINIDHVARLASLRLDQGEAQQLKGELEQILAYMKELDEVDTTNVEPTSHVHGIKNNFREDVVAPSLSVEEAIKNASDKNSLGFRVPKII